MRIIVDVMGGDNAPLETVKGAAEAAKELNAAITLVGNEAQIRTVAAEQSLDLTRFEIVHTDEVVTMDDAPLSVVRAKKASSMAKGLHLLADGYGDAFVSAGNTGALFTGATLIVRKVRGVQRAAIAAPLPLETPCVLLDAGANVVVTEEYLEQFAVMGAAYVRKFYGIESPAVGLLNNGTEECKGTPLQVAANARLRANTAVRYIGNVEAGAALNGVCNVLVADGFSGNVFLKTMEGTGTALLRAFKGVFTANRFSQLLALPLRRALGDLKHRFDPAEYGGSPFIGISKPVIKAHGAADARAFKNAIRAAVRYEASGVIYDIAEEAERFAAQAAVTRAKPAETPEEV